MQPVELRLPIDPKATTARDHQAALRQAACAALHLPADALGTVIVRRKSLDARKRQAPTWVYRCDVFLASEVPPDDTLPPLIRMQHVAKKRDDVRPVIVGMGPAGLFAALAFADAGVACTILDRGPEVEHRNLHVRDLRVHGQLHPESNLCFGEGGAGTYSDGKLYTRSKHPAVREVYERLVALGASAEILTEAHPHVGTNRLIPMMKHLRLALREAGHDVRFSARMTDLLVDTPAVGALPRVRGVRLDDGTELAATHVVLATGHSARDVYQMLARHGVAMARKDFAMGARVEHPQSLIDQVQLGVLAGHPEVGAAEYHVAQDALGRGVYSFCMCPGGFVLPSPASVGRLNVNGMSNSNRGSEFANAALVSQVRADEFYVDKPGDLDDDPDFGRHIADGALLGVALQERLERACFDAGAGGYAAPAELLEDFVADRPPTRLPDKTSYRPGVTLGRIDRLLPSRLVASLRQGARQIDRLQLRGYLSREAVIIGVETTTSSPVRVLRGDDRQSISHAGLYPCAEGAGYAGGIVSSAIEGLEAARMIVAGL